MKIEKGTADRRFVPHDLVTKITASIGPWGGYFCVLMLSDRISKSDGC